MRNSWIYALFAAWCGVALLLAVPARAGSEDTDGDEDAPRRESIKADSGDAQNLGDVIGIDLGTTYSCVGVIKNGAVQIITNDQGNRITPSYVAFLDDGTRVVGDAAKNQASMNPKNTVFDIKRLMGRRFNDKTVQYDKKLLPYTIINHEGKPYVEVRAGGSRKEYSPEEISSMILVKMKQIAETYLGHEVKNAVITCPAYFNDAQRHATKDAGAIAGLNVLRVINEPTAAALAYGLDKRTKAGHSILVFDLGGGTFDVTVLTIDDGVFEVQATNGDTHLGGSDFDQRVVEHFIKLIQTKHKQDVSKDLRALSKLRREAEKAKRALSTVHEVRVEIEGLWDGGDFSETLTRAKFEELNKDLFEKTIGPVSRVLKDAGIKKSAIEEIVLVGGSTRIPKVQQLLKDFFDGKELNKEINPDEAVAYGAAVLGGVFSGEGQHKDVLLLDVTPMSLGTAEVGGVFSRIIERNSVIPTKKSAHYTTVEDDQELLTVEVYQGERAKVKHNILLGKFDLHLTPQPRGVPDIKVTFEIDANGILHVEAEELSSGVKGNIVITADKNRLSQDEVDRMREEAEKYAEEDKQFQEKNDAKRELEEYCYVLKKRADEDKNMAKKFKKRVRAAVNKMLDWLEDNDIDRSSKKTFRNKKKNLKDEAEPIFAEAKKDYVERAKARAKAKAEGKPMPKEEDEADDADDDDDEEDDRRSRRRRRQRRDDDDGDDEDGGSEDGAGSEDDKDTRGSEGESDLDDFDLDALLKDGEGDGAGDDDRADVQDDDEQDGPASAEDAAAAADAAADGADSKPKEEL